VEFEISIAGSVGEIDLLVQPVGVVALEYTYSYTRSVPP
jgi:hypothetical protein